LYCIVLYCVWLIFNRLYSKIALVKWLKLNDSLKHQRYCWTIPKPWNVITVDEPLLLIFQCLCFNSLLHLNNIPWSCLVCTQLYSNRSYHDIVCKHVIVSLSFKIVSSYSKIILYKWLVPYPLGQRFSNFFQVWTTFISQNVLWTTLLLSPLKANLSFF
jgi:hypothetical protein